MSHRKSCTNCKHSWLEIDEYGLDSNHIECHKKEQDWRRVHVGEDAFEWCRYASQCESYEEEVEP